MGPVSLHIAAQLEKVAKGGEIGLGDRGAIALRFDDDTSLLKSTFLETLYKRGLPAGLGLIADLNHPRNNGVTWADLKEWCEAYGLEIWSHSYSHTAPQTIEELTREIVTSKEEIENAGIKCAGWMQPGFGTGSGMYGGIAGTNHLSAWDSEAGSLITGNYVLADAYLGGALRYLPTGRFYGGDHITATSLPSSMTRSQYLERLKGHVDWAAANGGGVEIMFHPQDIDLTNTAANKLHLNDYIALLDYIVLARQQGKIEVLTPSGLYYANPGITRRMQLVVNGDFTGLEPGGSTAGAWSATLDWTGKTFPQSGGPDGGPYFSLSNQASGAVNMLLQQRIEGLNHLGVQGETFIFECYARSNGPSNQKIRVLIQTDGQTLVNVQGGQPRDTIVGTEWTRLHYAFTIPKGKTFLLVGLGRNGNAGSGNGVDFAQVRIYKV